jgi:hypothetical protein
MGGPMPSTLRVEDVADLTAGQVEHLYLRPMREMAEAMKSGGRSAAVATPVETLPSRGEHVAALMHEHPDWSDQKLNDHYDTFAREWAEADRLEREGK